MRAAEVRGARARRAAVASMLLLVAGACSSTSTGVDSATSAKGPATTVADIRSPGTTMPVRPLRILVTNDDGVAAPGIDAVVEGLRSLPSTEVVVVAPATNQSGAGGQTTEGDVAVTDATTASGFPAKAVAGFPADTVAVAIDRNGIPWTPDLVVSGINAGQNLGPATKISGTVGAAQAAAKRGVPALAASQGIAEQPDFPGGAQLVNEWVQANRAALLAGTAPLQVVNLNVPTCTSGTRQETVEVPVAADFGGIDITKVDCTGAGTRPATDDVTAFVSGHATLSQLPPAA